MRRPSGSHRAGPGKPARPARGRSSHPASLIDGTGPGVARSGTIDRRRFLGLVGLAAGASALAGCRRLAPLASRPDFTVAYLTDPHVFGEKGAADGFARAVHHALDRPDPPALVINGGDLAFDVMATGAGAADAQYDLAEAVLGGIGVPVHHVIGNHDCLGVFEQSGMAQEEPLYGKRYFLERFGLPRAYHSFDHGGWHFVILDTVEIVDRGYRGRIDEEQLTWLAADLAATTSPTVLVGHIPLFTHFLQWRSGGAAGVPATLAVENAHEVVNVLVARPHVRLVLSGHIHVNESFRYNGIEFANVGAVSGNWWDGPRDGFEEGYALLSFRGDQVEWNYMDYGWEAVAPEGA